MGEYQKANVMTAPVRARFLLTLLCPGHSTLADMSFILRTLDDVGGWHRAFRSGCCWAGAASDGRGLLEQTFTIQSDFCVPGINCTCRKFCTDIQLI